MKKILILGGNSDIGLQLLKNLANDENFKIHVHYNKKFSKKNIQENIKLIKKDLSKINSIFDILWKLPKSYTDRSLSSKIKDLKIDEIQTVTIIPLKYSFPRVRKSED